MSTWSLMSVIVLTRSACRLRVGIRANLFKANTFPFRLGRLLPGLPPAPGLLLVGLVFDVVVSGLHLLFAEGLVGEQGLGVLVPLFRVVGEQAAPGLPVQGAVSVSYTHLRAHE